MFSCRNGFSKEMNLAFQRTKCGRCVCNQGRMDDKLSACSQDRMDGKRRILEGIEGIKRHEILPVANQSLTH